MKNCHLFQNNLVSTDPMHFISPWIGNTIMSHRVLLAIHVKRINSFSRSHVACFFNSGKLLTSFENFVRCKFILHYASLTFDLKATWHESSLLFSVEIHSVDFARLQEWHTFEDFLKNISYFWRYFFETRTFSPVMCKLSWCFSAKLTYLSPALQYLLEHFIFSGK